MMEAEQNTVKQRCRRLESKTAWKHDDDNGEPGQQEGNKNPMLKQRKNPQGKISLSEVGHLNAKKVVTSSKNR